MPDTLNQTVWDAHPVIRWLMTDGRRILGSNDFLEGFALCLREAGIDVTRITTGVPILHPQIFSFSGLWQLGKGASERLYRADSSQFAILGNSPIKMAYDGSPLRLRPTASSDDPEFPIVKDLRRDGITDYIVLPAPFSDRTNKALSIATTRIDGFSDGEMALFAAMIPASHSILKCRRCGARHERCWTPMLAGSLAAAYSTDKSGAGWVKPFARQFGCAICADLRACPKLCRATHLLKC